MKPNLLIDFTVFIQLFYRDNTKKEQIAETKLREYELDSSVGIIGSTPIYRVSQNCEVFFFKFFL